MRAGGLAKSETKPKAASAIKLVSRQNWKTGSKHKKVSKGGTTKVSC